MGPRLKTKPPLLVTGGGYLDRGTVTSAGASRGPARRGCRQRTLSGGATEGSVANSRGNPARATPLQPTRAHNRPCGARAGRAGSRADLERGQLQPEPRPRGHALIDDRWAVRRALPRAGARLTAQRTLGAVAASRGLDRALPTGLPAARPGTGRGSPHSTTRPRGATAAN